MKWTSLVVAALLASVSAPAAGQGTQQAPPSPTAAERWARDGDQVEFRATGFAFPLSPGRLSLSGVNEFTHRGEGLDNGLQYRTEDGAVFATVYVYLPGLAHPGLAAFATDRALRNASPRVTGGEIRSVAAGGRPGTALRADYGNYRDGNASSAAFVKAGRWMIKLRVTGPEARRAEVEETMSALLAGMAFRGETGPAQATPLAIAPCPDEAGRAAARALPDPPGAEIAAHAFLGTFDGGGVPATDDGGESVTLPSRVPEALCLSGELRQGNHAVAVLRAIDPPPPGLDGRTHLIGIISDSGTTLEVVEAENLGRHVTLYHTIGETLLLGGYDAPPSDVQIMEMLATPSQAGRIRSRVRLRPDGSVEMYLPSGATEPHRPEPVT